MVCPRCGAVFEGNFCPRCGTPAPQPVPAAAPLGTACPRCGTVYQGNFCPTCGLAAGTAPYPTYLPPRPPSGLRSLLSVAWILAIAGLLVFMALNVTALLASPNYVWPGIQGVTRGQIANQGLDTGSENWTFMDLGSSGATGTYAPSGGHPDGFLQMDLPSGTNVGGAWVQAFQVAGSPPFLSRIHFDVQILSSGSGPQDGRVVIGIEHIRPGLYEAGAASVLWLNGTTSWITEPSVDVSANISDPGVYYLKMAYLAGSNPAPAVVGFDNIHLAWITDAYFYVVAPLPLPYLLYFSQDPGQIAASYLFVVAAILVPVAYYSYRERKLLAQAFTAPLESIGVRLRSRATWVAIAQAWLAVTSFQFAIILLLDFLGTPATSPIQITANNTWFLLYDLARAPVFEELTFRLMLIGVPMALGSLLVRRMQTGQGRAPGGLRKDLLGAFRYLLGGQLRASSPREALLAGWILLFVSSAFFGLAHDVSWGFWKVVPAAVAGLAFGYLFLRHGIGAAILAHFLSDYLDSILLEGIGGVGLEAIMSLLLYALLVAGAGFFAWYIIYAWQHLEDLRRRYGHVVRQPVPTGTAPSPPVWGYVPPPPGGIAGGPAYGYQGAPPPEAGPPNPPAAAAPPYTWAATPRIPAPARDSALLPREYTPMYHPPPYGFPPVRFQCPYCGWVEARYEARHFTCLRCGRTT